VNRCIVDEAIEEETIILLRSDVSNAVSERNSTRFPEFRLFLLIQQC
jgi:hypothetical protein